MLQPYSQCWAGVFVRVRVAGMHQLPFAHAQCPFTHRQGPAAEGLGRGTRAAGHACLPRCCSLCVSLNCEENPTFHSVGHIYDIPCPPEPPLLQIAHRRHLPSLLMPASAVRATGPSGAVSWVCRPGQLPAGAVSVENMRPTAPKYGDSNLQTDLALC